MRTAAVSAGATGDRAPNGRVYLHIGWEKTGTSSIQAWCGRNREWLAERGYHYPLMGQLPQHVDLYEDLASGHPSRIEGAIRQVRQVLSEAKGQNVILSHERLHDCRPAYFREMFQGWDVRPVAYVRSPDEAVVSFFVTMIRFGYLPGYPLRSALKRFVRGTLQFFEPYWPLRDFREVFGRHAMTVRAYRRSRLVGENIVTDFGEAIGLQDVELSKWPESEANLSLDADQLAFALRVASAMGGEEAAAITRGTRILCDAILAAHPPDPGRPVLATVSRRLRSRILKHFEPSMRRLESEFGLEGVAGLTPSAGRQELGDPSPARLAAFHECLHAVARRSELLESARRRLCRDVIDS